MIQLFRSTIEIAHICTDFYKIDAIILSEKIHALFLFFDDFDIFQVALMIDTDLAEFKEGVEGPDIYCCTIHTFILRKH